ncbi:MAG: hypothetical protein ACTSYI_07175 [Promethearchaeota archaeon]
MNVDYKFYEPGKNWEENQARIYNDYMEHMPYTVFNPVNAEDIKTRINYEKKEPKAMQYALDEEGNPLAYIQITVEEKRVWIGYPWAMENCPSIVQETLYTDMLGYVKSKYPEKQVVMGYISKNWTAPTEFARNHGFQLCDEAYFYGLDLEEVPKPNETLEYTSRLATESDLPLLLEITNEDPTLCSAFSDTAEMINYYTNRVIPTGNAVMIFHKDQIVAASAPLQQFYKGINFRFQGLRPGFKEYWDALAYEIAQVCLQRGMEFPLVFTSFDNWTFLEPKVKGLGGKLLDSQNLYCLGSTEFIQ